MIEIFVLVLSEIPHDPVLGSILIILAFNSEPDDGTRKS